MESKGKYRNSFLNIPVSQQCKLIFPLLFLFFNVTLLRCLNHELNSLSSDYSFYFFKFKIQLLVLNIFKNIHSRTVFFVLLKSDTYETRTRLIRCWFYMKNIIFSFCFKYIQKFQFQFLLVLFQTSKGKTFFILVIVF